MKKTFLISLISITLGAIIGIMFNSTYKEKLINTFGEGKTYYFIQEGVYSSKEIMRENTKDILIKTVDVLNNKQYVYLGITRNSNNAKKIKAIYEKKGYQIYIKEQNLSNEESLTTKIKCQLYNLINIDVKIDGQKQPVSYAIDLLVQMYVKCLRENKNVLKQIEIIGLQTHSYE